MCPNNSYPWWGPELWGRRLRSASECGYQYLLPSSQFCHCAPQTRNIGQAHRGPHHTLLSFFFTQEINHTRSLQIRAINTRTPAVKSPDCGYWYLLKFKGRTSETRGSGLGAHGIKKLKAQLEPYTLLLDGCQNLALHPFHPSISFLCSVRNSFVPFTPVLQYSIEDKSGRYIHVSRRKPRMIHGKCTVPIPIKTVQMPSPRNSMLNPSERLNPSVNQGAK